MADDITVKVGFDGSQAETGLGKLRKESESFGDQLTKKLAGAFTAMALFDRGVSYAIRTFEKFADISDKAERAGINSEDFQRIGYAAELSGSSMEAAAKAMREIRNATADAAAGSKKATDALIALGFTREEITKGDIKSTDVLLKLALAYKAAGSDAAKFGVATSILSTRTASEMMPLLSTSQAELQGAMGRDVASQAVVDQMKAVADQAKMASQALEMFTIELMGTIGQLAGSINVVIGFYESRIGGKLSEAKESTGADKRKLESEALALFDEYARNFRLAAIGTTQNGELMTAKRVDEILGQKFAEMFPPAMQRERQQALADKEGITQSGSIATSSVKEPIAVVADSIAAAGGGGGVYSANTIDLATRTADATERIAETMDEWLERTYGSGPVSSD